MNRTRKWIVGITAIVLFPISMQVLVAAPLPEDSRILSGKLDNGVTWKFFKHDNPPGKMAMIMHVRTGSLNETDAQQGLAHFLEHMAFNGSENFAPGDLIPYFESIGMEFGADLNAFTSFDQTAYMLFLPNTETKQLDKALNVLSDYAFRMLLLEEEVDKERGVVLEESRRGKSAFQRIRDKLWPDLFAGTRFAVRLPIGKDEIIESVPRSEFVDYYRTWYRPENVTVILVGDCAPEKVVPLIESQFGAYRPEVPARKPHNAGFKPFTTERAMVVTDAEMAICEVGLMNITAGRPPVTTVAQWNTELIEQIGGWIMQRRFAALIDEGDASFQRANTQVASFFNNAVLVGGSAVGEPKVWDKMLEELIIEVSRANEFGFTEHEFELAKKELLADADRAVKTEPTVNARRFMFQIMSATNDRQPVQSAQQELDLYRQLLPKINLAQVNSSFKAHFTPGSLAYTVEMVENPDVYVPTKDEVLAAARAAWARKVTPPETSAAPTELLAKMPTPGKIVDSATDADLAVTSVWLSNGVRVHHRFMDYKKDTVLVSISLAGGEIEETQKNTGITDVALLAFQEPATSRLTAPNIRDIMTGKNINVRDRSGSDYMGLSITGSPKDLELGFQLANALLTDGKISEAAFKNWKIQQLQRIEMVRTNPMIRGFIAAEALLTDGDPRFAFATKEVIEQQAVARSQKWFDNHCRTAPIEVAVVGEISLDEAMALVSKYIGSLPKRDRKAGHLDKLRRVARPTGPLKDHVVVETVTPQGMAIAGFVACDAQNTRDLRALALASNIMSSRIIKRIREELAWVYSIRASHRPNFSYREAGRFGAAAPCDPANVDKVVEETHRLLKEFATNGPKDEELANAKKQIANDLDTEMKEPRYWARVLRNLDLHRRQLSDEKGKVESFQGYTTKQVVDVFRKYYTAQRQFQVTSVPVKQPASGADEKKKAKTAAPAS